MLSFAFQLPFAKNKIEYVLGKCKNLVGVMVFGHKASENILPWLHNNYNKKLLIQGSDVFLSHPQNIRLRYTLKHAQHYIQMFSEIMVPLGVVIPLFIDGLLLMRSFLTKKYTLEMMEEFVDSEVLEAVRQRIAMVKIERTAKVEELQGESLQLKEEWQRKKEQEEQQQKEKAQQKEEQEEQQRNEEVQRNEEQEEQQRKEEAQRKEEQLEQARQRKKEQEEQAPKARGKYKTFDDRMEDLKRFKETHGHANVTTREDIPLSKFCATTRYARNNPGKGTKLTDERIAAFDALGFNWMSKEYITKSFDKRIEDLKEYKRTDGHLSVKRNENNSLYQFCADVRHSLKQVERVWHEEADGRAHNKA
jgi:flagellar biosynthesis GTPase FlhF